MKGAPVPSPELEAAIQEAAAAIYGPGDTLDYDAAGEAVRRMLAQDARDPGDHSQQLAVGTLIADMVSESDKQECDDDAEGGTGVTPQRVMRHEEDGQEMDGDALVLIAAACLRERRSVRDQVMAYCALRMCDQTTAEIGELGEMRAADAARETVKNRSVTDLLTRVYSRRVIALLADGPEEVVDAIRQANEEGNPLEVTRLVEVSYHRLPPDGSMSVLALGISAASDLDNREQELVLIGALTDVICRYFHQLHHASPTDEAFMADERAIGLAGEMDVMADRLEREEGCASAHMITVAHSAVAYALLGRELLARMALERLQRFAGGRPEGMPEEAAALAETAEHLLNENNGGQPPDEAPDEPEPDPDDDRTDPASAWKYN